MGTDCLPEGTATGYSYPETPKLWLDAGFPPEKAQVFFLPDQSECQLLLTLVITRIRSSSG